LFREELRGGRLGAFAFRERFRFLRTILPGEDAELLQTESAVEDAIREERLVVPVDLFG
jgi:hypothetical protein